MSFQCEKYRLHSSVTNTKPRRKYERQPIFDFEFCYSADIDIFDVCLFIFRQQIISKFAATEIRNEIRMKRKIRRKVTENHLAISE